VSLNEMLRTKTYHSPKPEPSPTRAEDLVAESPLLAAAAKLLGSAAEEGMFSGGGELGGRLRVGGALRDREEEY
jgi:hypothetical protein